MVNIDPTIILTLKLSFQSLATCHIFEFQGTEEECWSFCQSWPSLGGKGVYISELKLQWTIPYCAVSAFCSIRGNHGSVK